MKFDRTIRYFVPSMSKLTFNPLFKVLVDVVDFPLSLAFSETRNLPPNHTRLRVGVGNRILNNQIFYLRSTTNFWIDAVLNRYITANSTILEIGVGCGRYAHVLRDFQHCDLSFTGQYIGIDIDEEMLGWCRRSFDDRFRFHLSTDPSKSYNHQSKTDEIYIIPEPDDSVDFVFSQSLFSHLLEREARNYLAESFRLMKPGGWASHSFFLIDHPPPTLGDRHTFSHKLGNVHVESLEQPEAAVAYNSEFVTNLAKEVGFTRAAFRYKHAQPVLICHKDVERMPRAGIHHR